MPDRDSDWDFVPYYYFNCYLNLASFYFRAINRNSFEIGTEEIFASFTSSNRQLEMEAIRIENAVTIV